jgi:hypothetical protein
VIEAVGSESPIRRRSDDEVHRFTGELPHQVVGIPLMHFSYAMLARD